MGKRAKLAVSKVDLEPLPDDWEAVRVQDVVLRTHHTDPTRTPDSPFKYIDVSAVSSERLRIESSADYLGKDAPSRARKLIHADDVIFATVRPYLKRVANVPSDLDGQIRSTAYCVLRAAPDCLDPGFLYFAAITDRFVQSVAEHQRGSSYPAVRDSDVLNEQIPLPPLPEQRAIAEVLRTVQRAKEATEKVIAACRHLKQSLMRHLVTYGPVPFDQADKVALKETVYGPVPEQWPVIDLRDAVASIDYGLSAAIPKMQPERGVRIVSTADVTKDGRILYGQIRQVEAPAKIVQRLTLRTGDVLFNWRNSPELVGKTAIFDETGDPHIFASFILRIRTGEKKSHNAFLKHVLNYYREQGVFLTLARRAVNQANYNRNEISVLKIALPPYAIQVAMAGLLRIVDGKLAAEQNRHRTISTLFNTLLHHLMTGKVRVV